MVVFFPLFLVIFELDSTSHPFPFIVLTKVTRIFLTSSPYDTEERKSYRFGRTWGWVNDGRIFSVLEHSDSFSSSDIKCWSSAVQSVIPKVNEGKTSVLHEIRHGFQENCPHISSHLPRRCPPHCCQIHCCVSFQSRSIVLRRTA